MSGQLLWYLSRSAGVLAIALLTGVVVLGLLTAGRAARSAQTRAVLLRLHRNITALALVFLLLHIATAILDGYVDLSWTDAIVPFTAGYSPFWVGCGALAVDLLLAIGVTSALRRQLPRRVWRAFYLSAYLCWPLAVAHGFFTPGGDSDAGWMIAVDLFCVAAVTGVGVFRLIRRTATAVVPPRSHAVTPREGALR